MEHHDKEVYFAEYCPLCKYHALDEHDEPCTDCLDEPVNYDSHRPVKFEQKEGK